MAHPRISLDGPLYRYRGNETPEPDFGRLAWKAARRFKVPVVRTLVAKATTEAMLAFGRESSRRRERSSEVSHDIHVSEIFLHVRSQGRADLWIGEDEIYGSVRPDAIVDGVALEFIGQYSKAKLIGLHRQYVVRGINAFEFW
jgi:hypothetical protein